MIRSKVFIQRVIALGTFCFLGCGSNIESQADRKDPAPAGPLYCAQPVIDVGETYEQATKQDFSVRNVGKSPVRVTKLLGSCACLEMNIADETLDPGQETTITLRASANSPIPGAVVHFGETLSVFVDQAATPCVKLRLAGKYVPPAYVLSHRLNIQAPAATGQPFEGTFDMYVNAEKGIDLREIERQSSFPFEATIHGDVALPGTAYRKKTIRVQGTLEEGTELPASAKVIAKTTSAALPELSFQLVLQKPPGEDVALAPNRLAFGILAQKASPQLKSLVVKMSAEAGAVVKTITSTCPFVSAALDEGKSKGNCIVVACSLDPTHAAPGAIAGEVVVLVSVNNKDQELRIPVSGFIKQENG